MNAIKNFFRRVAAYVKNTAWIQPILIVVIIFVLLFSLNPITEAIKKGWTNLTTVNKMEKITYKEYVEMVNSSEEGEKFIVVFTSKNSETCNDLYDIMNDYLKTDAYKGEDFKIYSVDITVKDSTTKVAGREYKKFKDSSCGIVSDSNIQNSEAAALDHVKKLDARIVDFVNSFGGSYSELKADTYEYYTYVSAPLFVWYENGLETRMCNTWSVDSYGSSSSFREFVTDFEGKVEADNWDDDFNLTYDTK